MIVFTVEFMGSACGGRRGPLRQVPLSVDSVAVGPAVASRYIGYVNIDVQAEIEDGYRTRSSVASWAEDQSTAELPRALLAESSHS